MIQCPVCRTNMPTSVPVLCERCGWDLETDVTLVTSLHEIPEEVRKSYERRIEIARRNWNERVQALEKQSELEKRLREHEALEQHREDELVKASEKQSELENRLREYEAKERRRRSEDAFIKKCRESDDPLASYRQYLSRYPDGAYRAEAESALSETGGKAQRPAVRAHRRRVPHTAAKPPAERTPPSWIRRMANQLMNGFRWVDRQTIGRWREYYY